MSTEIPYLAVEPSMPITLQYRGRILSSSDKNSKTKNKNELRGYFNPQLKHFLDDPPMDLYSFYTRGHTYSNDELTFHPLVVARQATCELNIKLLTRSKPGNLIHDGDLDNRLKTIFDALTMPRDVLRTGIGKPEKEPPFYVLLEDDCSITDFCVKSELLLMPPADEPSGYAELYVEVKVKTRNII